MKNYKTLYKLALASTLLCIMSVTEGCGSDSDTDVTENVLSCRNGDNYSAARVSDYKKSLRWGLEESEKLCSQDYALACYNLGVHYDAGMADYINAGMNYDKACKLNFGAGCHNLGDLHERGYCVSSDGSTAETYFARACELGYLKRCR